MDRSTGQTSKLFTRLRGSNGRRRSRGTDMPPVMRRSSTRLGGLAVAAAMAAPFLGTVANSPANAAGGTVDYASDAFSNHWDYSDPSDIVIGDGPLFNIANPSITGGQFRFDTNSGSYISPLWGGYPGALSSVLDGVTRPINTSVYNRLAFKITSTASVSSGVRWYTCPDGDVKDACQGGFAFDIRPGTNVYDFALKPSGLDPALDAPWSGSVTGIRLAFAESAHMDLDWMSVYGGNPPGDDLNGPAAKVINPDIEGGESLGTKLRGKPWDMTDPTDISRSYNVVGSAAGGVFSGTNAGPQTNDPSVVINLGCKTFKAADFHRFTVDMTYDGRFNVEDRSGGGMNQRVIWRLAGTPLDASGRDLQNSDDIVIYPGRRRFTIDLATDPATAINDPTQSGPKQGWTGEIEHVRFDPNEDPGARTWQIREIKLAADDMVAPGGSFKIEWADANYRPGGTATVSVSPSPTGSGAIPVASNVPVSEGTNVTTWTAATSGRFWVVLTIARSGAESTSVSTGPITIGSPQYTFGINERGKDGTLANGDRCPGSLSAGPTPLAKIASATPSSGPKTTKTTKKTLKPPKKK